MNIYLMIAIVIANAIAIGVLYQFIKKLPKKEKIIIIATSVASMYILISIAFWISGFGIDENIHNGLKNFITYLFVPVNVILFIPYTALQYKKFKDKKIKLEKFASKISTVIVVMIIVLVLEGIYFNRIQKDISEIPSKIEITNIVNNNETPLQNEILPNNEMFQQNVVNQNNENSQNNENNETNSNIMINENTIKLRE